MSIATPASVLLKIVQSNMADQEVIEWALSSLDAQLSASMDSRHILADVNAGVNN
jgi:hypothetical protein